MPKTKHPISNNRKFYSGTLNVGSFRVVACDIPASFVEVEAQSSLEKTAYLWIYDSDTRFVRKQGPVAVLPVIPGALSHKHIRMVANGVTLFLSRSEVEAKPLKHSETVEVYLKFIA